MKFKKDNKIKKLEKRIQNFESNNPEKARRLKGKLAALKARKDV